MKKYKKEVWKQLIYQGVKIPYFEVSNKGRLKRLPMIVRWMNNPNDGQGGSRVFERPSDMLYKKLRHSRVAQHMFTDVIIRDEEGFHVKKITIYIHKAVAETFIKNYKKKFFVSHSSKDFTDNSVDNLFWSDQNEISKRSILDHPENRNKLRDANIASGYYENGGSGARPKIVDNDFINNCIALWNMGHNAKQIANIKKCSLSSVYKAFNKR